MYRIDGRISTQHRTLTCQFGISDSDGSATFQLGATRVMVLVNYAEEFKVTLNPNNNEYVKQIQSLFGGFIKEPVHIDATMLQRDGSELACVVNCISMALADSGVHMEKLIYAMNLGIHLEQTDQSKLLIDPNYMEEQQGSHVTWFISHKDILGLYVKSPVQVESITNTLQCLPLIEKFELEIKSQIKQYCANMLVQRGYEEGMTI